MAIPVDGQISPLVGPEHPLDVGDGEVTEVHLELVDGMVSVELAGLPLEVGEVRFGVSVIQVLVFLVDLLSALVLSRYLKKLEKYDTKHNRISCQSTS